MSFADILPYLAGGLAGAAVPGLGRGAARAMSMQQSFEEQAKGDERYEEARAERTEAREYSRERDVFGDKERAEIRQHVRGREKAGDLERKEAREYGRGQDVLAWDFRNTEADYRKGQDVLAKDWREKVFDYGVGQDVERKAHRDKVFDYGVGKDREASARRFMFDGLQIQKFFKDQMKDDNQAAEYDNLAAKIKEFSGVDVSGLPPNAMFAIAKLGTDKKLLDAKAEDIDFITLEEMAESMDRFSELADDYPEGSSERAMFLSVHKLMGDKFSELSGFKFSAINDPEALKEGNKRFEGIWKNMAYEYWTSQKSTPLVDLPGVSAGLSGAAPFIPGGETIQNVFQTITDPVGSLRGAVSDRIFGERGRGLEEDRQSGNEQALAAVQKLFEGYPAVPGSMEEAMANIRRQEQELLLGGR